MLKNFHCQNSGYATVTFPQRLWLKDNASLKLIVDEEGKLLACAVGNTLWNDKSDYKIFSDISIKKKARGRQAY